MEPAVAAVLQEARPVLARLELVQHGSTCRLDPTHGARNAESALYPQGESDPPHERHRQNISRAPTAEAAQAALEDARQELHYCTRRTLAPMRTETLADLKARIVDDGAGWTPLEVSIAMRCTIRLVRVARTEANRNPESGRPLPPPGLDEWTWARELREDGLTIRQIAAATGLPKSTLHDRL